MENKAKKIPQKSKLQIVDLFSQPNSNPNRREAQGERHLKAITTNTSQNVIPVFFKFQDVKFTKYLSIGDEKVCYIITYTQCVHA